MKHVIITELRRNFRSFLLWTAIVAGLALLMLSLYPAFEDAFSKVEELLSVYPESFLEVFGLGENGLDMTDIYGWFGVEGYLFVTLIGGSYAAILGSSILSKEEDEKTIEFLLSKPISRTELFFSKAIVVGLNLLAFNIVIGLVLLIAFSTFSKLNVTVWLLYTFAPLLLQLFFASISMMIGVFITKSRTVISISLSVTIGMYVIDIISSLTDNAKFLKYVTPYEYINAVSIVKEHTIKPLYLFISLFITVSCLIIAWRSYNKKDISI
jgi:ABC-2 type transport system permease protein